MNRTADYLRKIELRETDHRGRWKPVPESRWRTYRAVKQATRILTREPDADLRRTVAVATAAAEVQGADIGTVCKHVRHWRTLSRGGETEHRAAALARAVLINRSRSTNAD